MGHREDLLAGARRCLYELGYAHTTARDIVRASGTNLASIGYHFGSKDALLNAALVEALAEWGDELEKLLAAVPDDLGTLERFEAAWSLIIESFERNRPLIVASFEGLSQLVHDPALREQRAIAQEHGRLALAALFHRLSAASAAHETVRTVGSFYMALLAGVMAQWLIDPETAPSGHDLAQALKVIVRGIEAEKDRDTRLN